MLRALLSDDAGFIISAELVLIASLLVIGLIVGMSQVQFAIVEEMNDIAHSIGSLNQGFYFSGFSAEKRDGCGTAIKSRTYGSSFHDSSDVCDYACNQITCDQPVAECGGWL
jgi:hypothetical protein